MDPARLTVPEIAAYLASARRVPEEVFRRLACDPRASVAALVSRYQAIRAAERRERARLRALYREDRRRTPLGRLLAGVDEAGRGPLAGPVFAGAVILGSAVVLTGLDDSKRLTPEAREVLDAEIRTSALAVGIGEASVEEIDRWNILGATRLAMRRAVAALTPPPDYLLIDGRDRLPAQVAQATVIDGDATCASIAAASIVAKVARDRAMRTLDEVFPEYGFARHKGYATAEHFAALARHGPCLAHRRAFLPEDQLSLFECESPRSARLGSGEAGGRGERA